MDIPRAVIAALESPDPTAWVDLYAADAVLMEPGEAPVEGREALLEMARSMINGRPPEAGTTTNVRVLVIWRKEADGIWRLAHEVFAPDSQRE